MTDMQAWSLPEFLLDGEDVAFEPEWRAEPAATPPAGRWAGELMSPFVVSSPAPVAETDLPGESGPFSVDGELLAWAAEIVQVPQQVRDALGRQAAGEAVDLLVNGGVRDEEWLTNLVFHARHRELGGMPVEGESADEWQAIRDGEVRPRLATDETGVADQLEGEGPGNLIGNAVRDAMARNAVRTALAGGERDENTLTDAGYRALPDGGGQIRADDPRFTVLKGRWTRIRDRVVRPLLAEQGPIKRPCCLLFGPVVADLDSLGTHGTTAGEKLGEVYTRKLGFIDLGHARETADVTLWVLAQLRQQATAGTVIRTVHGSARLKRAVPVDRRLAFAQQLAYVDSVEHEIVTFGVDEVGADNSSFSPEDLRSNLFGTQVAAAALRTGGSTVNAITRQFKLMLRAAGAQTVAVARQVQTTATNRGWWGAAPNSLEWWRAPLRKRNLTADPWLIDEHGNARIGHGALPSAPSLVSQDFEYTSGNTGIKNTEFAQKIATIRAALPASAVIP